MFYNPLAADCVLKEKGTIPLTMIPVEVANKVTIGAPILNFLSAYSHPLAKAYHKMLWS